MKITALLPMKGHAERVPNKNIKNFCGRPLYHVVLTPLLQSEYINNVVINTDSYGAHNAICRSQADRAQPVPSIKREIRN